LRHDVRIENNTVTVSLEGSMYAIDAANLRDTIHDLIRGGNTKFIFDLSALDYMDSTGLGLFIFIDEELKAKGGKVTLNGLTGRVKTLFERTRLYDVFVTK
jgi:anti-sigma B factor antagonist